MTIKEINQSPERYTKEGAQWKISASKDIKPIYLPIGVPIQNLKPVIKADGIIVKIGNDHLCSLTTLNTIKKSNNPHYDIVENGSIVVKGKRVSIGKTVKIIELDVVSLQKTIDDREFMNRQSGVVSISYINNPNESVDGIPKKLIDQINYTLDKGSERPSDRFEVVNYFNMVDKGVSPHYTVVPIRVQTDQQKTIFEPTKLRTFLIGLDEQLKLLKRDFNTIQSTFFTGSIPTPNPYGVIQKDVIARTDVDDNDDNHSIRTTESSQLISVEPIPINTIKTEVEKTKVELEDEIAETNESVKRKIEEERITIEQRIQQGQSTDSQNQNYLASKIQELQQQINGLNE